MTLKLIVVLSLTIGVAVCFPPITITKTMVDEQTNDVEKVVGQCTCDVTPGSCDAYCCCDQDCPKKILAFWKKEEYCAKNVIGDMYKPEQRCIKKEFMYWYNKRMGMQISDDGQSFCVELDIGDSFSPYVKHLKKSELPVEVGVNPPLKVDNLKYPLSSVLSSEQPEKQYLLEWNIYSPGQEMVVTRPQEKIQHWPFPQRDMFGFCNNFKAPGFLQDQNDEGCLQAVSASNAENAAETFLNPQSYFSNIYNDMQYVYSLEVDNTCQTKSTVDKTKRSVDCFKTKQKPIKLGKVYKLNQGVITEQIDELEDDEVRAKKSTVSGSTISSVVKEVFYRVSYKPLDLSLLDSKSKKNKFVYIPPELTLDLNKYTISEVKVDLVIQDVLQVNNDQLFEQKFSIEFQPAQLTTPEAGMLKYRSGNPGYELNESLIVADAGYADVPKDFRGFVVAAARPDGVCLQASENNLQRPQHKLRFGQTTVLTCRTSTEANKFKSANDFQTYCLDPSKQTNLLIFDQFLNKFKYLAVFGNPNTKKSLDWIEVIKKKAVEEMAKAGTYDEKTQECRLTGSLEIEILTSKMGAHSSEQMYIAGAEVRALTESWIYHPNYQTTFQYTAAVSFREVLPPEMQGGALSMLNEFSKELFYPITLKKSTI